MDDRSDTRRVRELLSDAGGARAARYAELERQKRELRDERDALLIALARDGGERGLAASLQVAPEVARRLLSQARNSAGAEPSDERALASPLGLGSRDPADADRRWAEADTYYEALGAGPPATFARRSRRG
jgi:hypothetical protein